MSRGAAVCRIATLLLIAAVSLGSTSAAFSDETLWEGKLHLGDTANYKLGSFKDAAYAGLFVEFPVTLTTSIPDKPSDISFNLDTTDIQILAGPGHKLSVYSYVGKGQGVWEKVNLAETFLKSDHTTIILPAGTKADRLVLDIDVDRTPGPGFMDDFILTGLSLVSTTHKGVLGF